MLCCNCNFHYTAELWTVTGGLNPENKSLGFYVLNWESECKNKLKIVNLGPNLEQLYLNINWKIYKWENKKVFLKYLLWKITQKIIFLLCLLFTSVFICFFSMRLWCGGSYMQASTVSLSQGPSPKSLVILNCLKYLRSSKVNLFLCL